jgi:glycogen synthase
MMRIALFPSAYQPSIGGVEELSRQLALQYVAKGHQVSVYTNRWPRSLPSHEVLDGIDVHRLPFRLPHASLRGRMSYPVTNRVIASRLRRLLARQKAGVLHVQCVSSNTHYALLASEALGLPLVVTTQGELTMDAERAFERGTQLPTLLRRASIEATAFTACSAKTLADVEAFLGGPIPGAQVIFNGADVTSFAAAQPVLEGEYILAIGRLARQKGFDLLLRAWNRLDGRGHRLVIVGSGPEDVALRSLASDLRLGPSVEFYGPADRATVPRLFAGASMVVIPSRADEGLPLVSIETMAAGRAFVATVSGGCHRRGRGPARPPRRRRSTAIRNSASPGRPGTPGETWRCGTCACCGIRLVVTG